MTLSISSLLALSDDIRQNYGEALSAIEGLEIKIGYEFKNKALLYQAMTHRSFPPLIEKKYNINLENNEKLEFLGDSILSFFLAEVLIKRKDCDTEKDASAARAAISSNENLMLLADALGLDRAILRHPLAQDKQKALSDALEALIGAVFLDGGLPKAKALIGRLFKDDLATRMEALKRKNYRLYLRENHPELSIEHTETLAICGVKMVHKVSVIDHEGIVLAKGEGESKKMAETRASRLALEALGLTF